MTFVIQWRVLIAICILIVAFFRKVLIAACQKNALVIIDPLTHKTICKRENAHRKRCNTVTFIDDNLFVTCSDDHNISIWDIRYMKEVI